MLKNVKLALIGAGQMGGALLKGLLDAKRLSPNDIVVSDPNMERINQLRLEFGINTAKDNLSAVGECNVVLLAVKPQLIDGVLAEIADGLSRDNTLISIAAGISTSRIYSIVKKNVPVLRVMPNTPALVGRGMAVISPGKYATKLSEEIAEALLSSVGEVVFLDEKYQNQATAINGSGPAYVFLFAEALIDAGVKVGLPRDVSAKLVIETIIGAAVMLKETNKHPAVLKDMVASPGGTTIAALKVFEGGGLRGVTFKAVEEAVKRAEELGG